MNNNRSHYAVDNLHHYIMYVTKLSNLSIKKFNNITINITNSTQPLFNYVFFNDIIDDKIDQKSIKKVLQFLKKIKLSSTWVVDSNMTNTKDLLEKSGLILINKVKKLILNIKDYNNSNNNNKEITFHQVNNIQNLRLLDNSTSNIFHHDKKIVYDFFKGLINTPSKKLKFFLVNLNNNLVGTCGIFIHNKIAGFYSDGVFTQYRKQGIGTQMIKERIEIAKKEQCTHVIAHCMNSSIKIYSKLGFNTTGNLYLYISNPI